MSSLNDVSSHIRILRNLQTSSPLKVGFVASCFDLLHAGHYLMLQEAKSNCDILVVALQTDPSIDRPHKNKPVQTYDERIIQLSGVKYVDLIIKYETENDLLNILTTIFPDVRFLGTDYVGKSYTGDHLSIPIVYIDRSHGYSTSDLRRRVVSAEFEKLIGKPSSTSVNSQRIILRE